MIAVRCRHRRLGARGLGQSAQMAPTNIDQAIYFTCRQPHAMNPEARKALAMGVPRQPGRGQGRCGRQRLRPVAGRHVGRRKVGDEPHGK